MGRFENLVLIALFVAWFLTLCSSIWVAAVHASP
jgi:hypothetical protein